MWSRKNDIEIPHGSAVKGHAIVLDTTDTRHARQLLRYIERENTLRTGRKHRKNIVDFVKPTDLGEENMYKSPFGICHV